MRNFFLFAIFRADSMILENIRRFLYCIGPCIFVIS